MSGTIRITREKNLWANRLRRFTIVINGQEAATIKRGETIDLPVPAGPFSARATIDWTGSPTFTSTIADGEVLAFVVGNGQNVSGLVDSEAYLELRPAR